MDAETITKILSLADPLTMEIDGLNYSRAPLNLIPPPEAKGFDVTTLDGFVNMLEAGVDNFEPSETLIHVKGVGEVQLVSRAQSEYGKRKVYVSAGILEGMTKFPYFNQFGGQEEFVIGLQSHFQKNDDLLALIKMASHINLKEQVTLTDSGLTQDVTIQKGQAFKDTAETKERVNLKPFRTFRELDQPASDFIFRVKSGGGFALFEADGGAWKLDAISKIASWLANRIKTSDVENLASLPIIS